MLKIVLTQSRMEHWRHAALSICFYAFGALMPVWLSLILLVSFSKPIGLGIFLDNGQFAIYAAAALSPLLYALFTQGKGQERALYLLLILCGLILCALLVAAVTFSGLTAVEPLTIGELEINVAFLRVSSMTVYFVSLIAMLFFQLHEIVYNEVNIPEQRSIRQDRLEEEFDRLVDSPENGP